MMTSPLTTDKAQSLYESDYLAWIEATLAKLSQEDYDSVDWNNLIEELSGMARSEQRWLKSNLRVVLMHLLKWQYQPERRSSSWKSSIIEHRIRVDENLNESPSLQPLLEREFSNVYRDAAKIAAAETGLSVKAFPADCPYAIAQVLDENFLPE